MKKRLTPYQMMLEEQQEFFKWCEKYYKKFGQNYGRTPCDTLSYKEHIALIRQALRTGKPIVRDHPDDPHSQWD